MRKSKKKGAYSLIRRMLCVILAAAMVVTSGLEVFSADTSADAQTASVAVAVTDTVTDQTADDEENLEFLSVGNTLSSSSRDSGFTLLASSSGISSTLYNSGGKRLTNVISGITYDSVLGWLSQHRSDSYYLGTPYPETSTGTLIRGRNGGTDYRNPNGDKSGQNGYDDIAGQAMMNCTGFVWHVLYKASGKSYTDAYNSIPCWGGVGASNWRTFLRSNKVEYKTYYTNNASDLNNLINAVVNDGYIASGDIIWTWDSSVGMMSDGLPSTTSGNHHIGIYTGTYFGGSSTEWWDSIGYSPYTSTYYNTNLRSTVTPKTWCYAITVIKLGESKGSAKIVKSSGNASSTSNNSYYSLAGAKYGVYSGSTLVATLTTDSSGNSQTVTLAPGTYTVKEISASKGFSLDTTTYTINVTAGNTSVVRSTEPMQTGSLTICKYSKDTSTTGSNDNYDLSGAVFGIYTNSSCSGTAYKTVTLGGEKNHYSSYTVTGLPFGTYYIKEITPPTGYLLSSPTIQAVTVNSSAVTTAVKVGYYNPPIMVTVKLVKKADVSGIAMMVNSGNQGVLAEAGEEVKQAELSYHGDYTLEGATYSLFSTYEDAENGVNAIATAKTNADGEATFPKTLAMGTYYVKEINAPDGYILDETVYTVNATSPAVSASNTEIEVTSKEKPESGKVIVYKQSSNTSLAEEYPEYYSMDGAEYTVYYDEACGEVAGVITIKDGVGELDGVFYGDVWIKETKAPQAEIDGVMTDMYELDETVYKKTIGEKTQTVIVESTDEEPVSRTIYVYKGPLAMLENGTNFTKHIPGSAKSVVFTNSKTIPTEATSSNQLTDVSFAQNGGIMAWLEGTTWYVQSVSGGAIYFNYDSSLMFAEKYSQYDYSTSSGERSTYGGHKLTSIDFGSGVINTSYVTNMSYMFRDCEKLSTISNLTQFSDTSNVTNMMWMFAHCESLSGELNLSAFETSNVTDMSYMFAMCTGISGITVNSTNWDTSNVTGFDGMFYDVWGMNSTALQTMVDAMEISTTKSVTMENMFKQESCAAYLSMGEAHGTLKTTEINFVNWDFSMVTDMSQMFYGFDSVQYFHYVVVGKNVTSTSHMFRDCYAFGSKGTAYVKLESSKVVSYDGMFTRTNANSSGTVLYLQYTSGNYNLANNMVTNTRSNAYVQVMPVSASASSAADTLTASAAVEKTPLRSAIRSVFSGIRSVAAVVSGSSVKGLFLKASEKLGGVTEAMAATADRSLTNAVYSAYYDRGLSQWYGDFTYVETITDTNGEEVAVYALENVPYGQELWVKEEKASTGYLVDENMYYYGANAADGTYCNSTEIPDDGTTTEDSGKIDLKKSSADTGATANNSSYSLAGAEYTVYKEDKTTVYGTFITDEYGAAKKTLENVPFGTYYIVETVTPEGYEQDPNFTSDNPYKVVVSKDDPYRIVYSREEPPVYGSLRIYKRSSDTGITDGNDSYSLKGAVFGIYKDEACTKLYASVETGATGFASLSDVPLGTYYIQEITPPPGYELSTEKQEAVLTTDNSPAGLAFTFHNEPDTGTIIISKYSDNTSVTSGNSDYSLKGAKFKVYDSDGDLYTTLTTDENGYASVSDVPLGNYTVKETEASEGYRVSSETAEITLSATKLTYTVPFAETPKTMTVEVRKASSDTSLTDGNDNYSMEDAGFGVYSDVSCDDSALVTTIETDEKGEGVSVELAIGTYYMKEIRAPKGYGLNETIFRAVGAEDGTVTYTDMTTGETVTSAGFIVEEPPETAKIRIYKESDNRELTDDLDNYSLEGAVYGVYKSEADAQNDSISSDGTGTKGIAYLTTDENGYTDYTPDIPYGTYYIKETLAPEGFRVDENIYTIEVTQNTEQAAYTDESGDTVDASVVYDTDNSSTQEAAVTLSVQDSPSYDSITLKILKKSAQEDSAGSLEGAQFLIQYYDGDYSAREDLENVSAEKYWIIETQKSGNEYLAELTEDYLTEDSSDLYYDADGNVTLPVGTYVLYEYTAPESCSTKGDWSDSEGNILKQEETVSRAAVSYDGDVVTQTETDSTIILHVRQDEDGNTSMEATACDEDSEWTVTLEPDGDNVVTLTKEDMALGSITIQKQNSDGTLLEGVTYTLYQVYGLEDGSYEEVASGTTDGTGSVLFDELEYGTYRIEETGTLDGYTLLAEPILVTIPYETTVEEAEALGADMSKAIYSSSGSTCCFVDLTYTITDTENFKLPSAGVNPALPATLAVGLAALAFGLFMFLRRKSSIPGTK